MPLRGRSILAAIAVVAALGAVLAADVGEVVGDHERRAVEDVAVVLVEHAVRPLLDPVDFGDDRTTAGLDERRAALSGLLADRDEIVTLTAVDGALLLSTAPAGTHDDVPAGLTGDQPGPTATASTTTTTDGDGVDWVHVRVPVSFADGPVVGDVVVSRPAGPTASAVRGRLLRGVVLLGAALLLVLLRTARTPERAAAAADDHVDRPDLPSAHDHLTGLPNRVGLIALIEEALASDGPAGRTTALLVLDLDRFKEVNGTLGHPAGDTLLRLVADRLAEVVGDGVLARLGGDEFGVLLAGAEGHEDAALVAAEVARALDPPFLLGDVEVTVGTSIGISCAPQDAADCTDLLRHADVAMYEAKQTGGEVRTYDPGSVSDPDVDRLALLGGLRRAIEEDQLVLHYQPQLELATGRIACVEALVRWQHPTRGLLGPGVFIDLAEQSGLMAPLTTWVLETALAQLGEWDERGFDLAIAVNVSPRTLVEPGFAARIFTSLTRWGVDPCRLELEITEHELVEQHLTVNETLQRLRGIGVRIAIDDFGTGYSSLSYLTGLPVDVLKIDRSLVDSFSRDEAQATVLRSVCELGHALGYAVVAEGVEEDSALPSLHRLGVDLAQGYALWRPAPGEAITGMLVSAAKASPTNPTGAAPPPPPTDGAAGPRRGVVPGVAGPGAEPPVASRRHG